MITSKKKKEIGKRVQSQRKVLALTQAQLAEQVDLDTVYISQIERGQKLMSLSVLFAIAKALKITPGFILDGKKAKNKEPLLLEIEELLSGWNTKQRKAVLAALRSLKGL